MANHIGHLVDPMRPDMDVTHMVLNRKPQKPEATSLSERSAKGSQGDLTLV